jgi:hypothetical protein
MTDIESLHRRFESEVTTAAITFYAWKSINVVASKDNAVHRAMNSEALSWNAITHSLQTTALITLGRIFDTDHGALSVHSYLNKCISSLDQFGPDHLRQRKIRLANGAPTPWLDDYIADAEYPEKEDFRDLKRTAKQFQKRYEAIYKPIRNQVLAHSDLSTVGNAQALFAKTRIGDIQETLEFLYQLCQVVFQFLHNGRRTKLTDFQFRTESEVRENVESLLARLRDV